VYIIKSINNETNQLMNSTLGSVSSASNNLGESYVYNSINEVISMMRESDRFIFEE
jgi:hypothetical protein